MFETNTAIKLLIEPQSGRIVDANTAAVEFYGWPRDVLRSMRITDINTLSQAEVEAELQNARTGRRKYFRFRHRTAGGEIRHVEVHSGPIEVGAQEFLFSIVHDVTERDRLEEQLQQSQRLEGIGRLAGGVAHDFNNLLTVMLTTAGAMARYVGDDPDLRGYVEDLMSAAQRAAALTRELLAFSRRQVMQPRSVQLNEVISEMEGLLRRTLGHPIDLRVEPARGLPLVYADPSRIDQVIMNLVLNARDAMPSGGRLTLRTAAVDLDEDNVALLSAGKWVTLSVSDTGSGMDETTRAKLFEPFFSGKPGGQGTGLGLSTAYGIVKQSGGNITVTTEPGDGSEFVVYLPPTTDAPAVPADAGAETRAAATGDGTVLVAEDMDEVRAALAGVLRRAGFQVLEAASAAEALDLSDSEIASLDAVVTDVVMSGSSGIDLAATLLEERPGLPVLLITGDVRNHDLERRPPGARLLQKPFEGDELVRVVLELLDAKR